MFSHLLEEIFVQSDEDIDSDDDSSISSSKF